MSRIKPFHLEPSEHFNKALYTDTSQNTIDSYLGCMYHRAVAWTWSSVVLYSLKPWTKFLLFGLCEQINWTWISFDYIITTLLVGRQVLFQSTIWYDITWFFISIIFHKPNRGIWRKWRFFRRQRHLWGCVERFR